MIRSRFVYPAMMMFMTGILALSGCSRSPRATFYTLMPTTQRDTAIVLKSAPTVAIASITLPELVDRPQLVVRSEGPQVEILEMHRWAEPLRNGISRLMAENLSRILGLERVSAYPQNASLDADYRIFVDIQRFESGADGVSVDALWTVRSSREGKPLTGRSQIREPAADKGHEAMVAAFSRAIATVSMDIARSIQAATKKDTAN